MTRDRIWTPFAAAAGVIALHVADDSFLQPDPGTTAGEHLVSGLVPMALLAGFVAISGRLSGARRGALALLTGVAGLVAGVEAVHYTRSAGASGDDYTGWLALAAGLFLAGLGAVTLWRTRSRQGSLPRRAGRRALYGVAGFLVLFFVVAPVGLGYITTHAARAVVPPDRLGVAHEDVTFTTSDGLALDGWYVPSRNGAAVIAFPGRKGPQAPARVLARHGYGVLLFDRRGEGTSEGRPNSWGWGGDADVKAAVRFLQARPDVDPGRIGGLGLSVGGELMLEAAAETEALAAVVSEGAGARMFSEELSQDIPALDRVPLTPIVAIKNAAIGVFADQAPPPDLETLTPRIAPRPLLLIAAPESGHGEELNRRYHAAAGPTSELWELPESGHVGALEARPQEYERRVVGFFDRALGR